MMMVSSDVPLIPRAIDLPAMLAKKSYFLLGPRQTGKSFLIRHTLAGVRLYDLLGSATYLALSRSSERNRCTSSMTTTRSWLATSCAMVRHRTSLPFAHMRTTIDVEHLPSYQAGLGEIEHGVDDILDINNAS